MLLSNCHNSLYKGENLLAIDYLLRAVRRFTLSGFSPEGVLTRVYTERGLCALWEIFKVGHFEGLAIERGKSPQRGLKCFLQGSFTSHPHLSPGNDTAGLRLRFWKWQPSLRKLFDAGKIRRTIKVAEGWLAYLLSSPWKLCFYLLTYIERFKIVSHLTFDLPFKFNRLAWKVKMIMMVYRAICFWLLLFVPAIYWHTGNDGDSKYCYFWPSTSSRSNQVKLF